jgi:O-antigen/teichoic acid export membrane protein
MPDRPSLRLLNRSKVGRRLARFARSSFGRGLAILTSATLLQNLIAFGSAPIVSRLFAPADFGIAGLIYAVGVVPVLLASGQYYSAIGIARTASEAVNVVFLSLCLVVAGTFVSLPVAFYLQANPQLLPDSLVGIAPFLWMVPAFILATNLILISRLWEIRHASYRPQVVNRLVESGGIALGQIVLGLFGAGPLGLIVGRWLGTAAAGFHGLKLMHKRIGRRGLRAISLRRMRMLSRRHWRFPAYGLPAAVLNGLTPQLTPILLGLLYTMDAVGSFWFASRLLDRPAIIWGQNFGRVFYQHAADRRKEGQPIGGLFRKATIFLAASAIVPFGVVIVFGPSLFGLIFGTGWETAGQFARWIAVANVTFLIGFPARMATTLFNLQRTYAIAEAARASASAGALVLVAMGGGNALVAIAAAACAQSVIMLTLTTIVGIRLRQHDQQIGAPDRIASVT